MADSKTVAKSRQAARDIQPHSFHAQLIDNLYDGVYFVDANRTITYWNKGAEELTGYSGEEAMGRRCFDNFLNHVDCAGRGLCLKGCPLSITLGDGARREMELFLQHRDGHRVAVSVRTSPIVNDDGEVVGAVEIFTDVSAKKQLERRAASLEKMALNDALTGIPNRRYTQARIRQAIQESRQFARSIGLLMFDLDFFKHVNDTYGHEVGDAVLQTASRTLTNGLRPRDFVGRWGGEEFLAIVFDVTEPELALLAERTRALLQQSKPAGTQAEIHVTASMGATLLKPTDTLSSVVARADALMYKSKTLGRNQVTVG